MPVELEVKLKGIDEWQLLGDYNPNTASTFILILKGNPAIEDVRYKHFEWVKQYTDKMEFALAVDTEKK